MTSIHEAAPPGRVERFNTGSAVRKLLEGKPLEEVFPGFTGPIGRIDLEGNFQHLPINGKMKSAVNTLRTAGSVDAANLLESSPLTIERVTGLGHFFRLSKVPVTPELAQGPIRTALDLTSESAKGVLRDLTRSSTTAPVLERVIERMTPLLSPELQAGSISLFKLNPKPIITGHLLNFVETVGHQVPTFFRTLLDKYHSETSEYPDFQTFWKMVENSMGILLHPAVNDVDYLFRVYESLTYTDRSGYHTNTSLFDMTTLEDGSERVTLTASTRDKLSELHQSISTGDDTLTTGCPAIARVKVDGEVIGDLVTTIVKRTGLMLNLFINEADAKLANGRMRY